MNKGVLLGGGLGLLVLAFLGGFWLAGSPTGTPLDPNPAPSAAPTVQLPPNAAGTPGQIGAANPLPPSGAGIAAPAGTPEIGAAPGVAPGQPTWTAPSAAASPAPAAAPRSREERRNMREQVRALSAELQAKGTSATMEDVRVYLDKVERLGGGDFDPRYFNTMRQIVDQTARAQVLNQELAKLSQSTGPADVARRQAILAELRDISGRVSGGAAALQSYANEAAAAAGTGAAPR